MQPRMKMYSAVDVPIIMAVFQCAFALQRCQVELRLARGVYEILLRLIHTHTIRFEGLRSPTDLQHVHMPNMLQQNLTDGEIC